MAAHDFEKFLSESFSEGVYFRELRLSQKEIDAVRTMYPAALIKQTSEVNDVQSKAWYEINLLPVEGQTENVEAIRHENTRLKRELEVLKQLKN
ncbi:hypothetical protein SAMN05216353_13522 [Halobacillus alkaliphilus]|uniref:Uncharacterized protein n=1 Tax=Halobacillus alkaliphilus TaxID=396056 RepID=A0A1I2R329_9BACI|nr:hypothetical protein [Halobacillus alkaliphilus]SFG32987.1 hypothetical protein SAMN05216353_13522 [Halobacillus alkaliphilus]